jgi:hypothetical protein
LAEVVNRNFYTNTRPEATQKPAKIIGMLLRSATDRRFSQENRCLGPFGMDTNIPILTKPGELV